MAGLESAAAEVGLSEGALSNDAGSLKGDMDASRLNLGSSTSAGTFTGFGLALMPGSADCWTVRSFSVYQGSWEDPDPRQRISCLAPCLAAGSSETVVCQAYAQFCWNSNRNVYR